MSPEMKKAYLRKLPYGPSWIARVDKMSDAQASAVYQRKLDAGDLKGIKL